MSKTRNRHFAAGTSESEEALNMDMLETVHIAGARFDRMIKRLLGV